ncbi:hypothetical protein [Acinetobacter nosocomialis]|uniref:hypothetical protein n=1 Tax=Acinetobacter nosocomialis TaxID=106654 RepID=UPI0024DEFA0B|nr:hypothetical protein [Acinetobacter nosocomialis]
MSVPAQTPSKEYIANGTTTAFPLEFNCDKAEYLIVTLNGEEAPVGSWTLANDTVTFNVAPLNGVVVNLERNTPFQRTTNYQLYDNSFRPSAVNKDFDLIWWKLQELGYRDQVIWLALVKEIADRIAGDTNLQNQINTIEQQVDLNTQDIAKLITDLSQEIADRITGDQILKDMFLSMIDEAINEGTINALAITHLDSLEALEGVTNVWDGRTIYIKDLGNYRYDALTTSWVKAYQDADNVMDGSESQHQINNQTIRTVASVSDLINIRNPINGQVVFVRDDSINYSYDGTSWQIASKTRVENGEFQVLSNGVWKTKDPSYYDFGAKVDGVTDDTAAFIAYHKKFKQAHLDGRMLLRPIDIDQFITDQNLGLDISGDGNTKSYFIFDGEKGFYSAENRFFRNFNLKNLGIAKKNPTKTGIGIYVGSAGSEQLNFEFVGYDGWGIGRATHQWNSNFRGEVYRDCKHPMATYGTSSDHANCYANRCTSPYLFGYAVSSDGVVTVPSIPFAYSDLSGIAADGCGNDGSVYKIGYCSGIDLNSLSCEMAQGEYIFDLTDVSQRGISKAHLNNFSMYVNSSNPNIVGIFKSPIGKRPNFVIDGITIFSDKNIVLFSGNGSGCEIKNYSFNDRVLSSLTADASKLIVNDVQVGDGAESIGEQGYIISANNDAYSRVKTIKGQCFIDPSTQKVIFYAGNLNERLAAGMMVACKVTLHPLNRNGNNSGEKHGEVFFSSAMDYNATDMSGHLNVVRTGTLTTMTTVSRNLSTGSILSFDLVVEVTSPGTRFLVDFEYTYNGIQNVNGKCWAVQNK